MKPVFQHDCTKCQYIGTTSGPDRDWYICESSMGRTILAREGDDGPEYWSSPVEDISTRWHKPIGHFGTERKSLSTMQMLAYAMLLRGHTL